VGIVEEPADRLAMLDVDEFGVDISFAPHGSPTPTLVLVGIYDDAHESLDFGADADVSASAPRVHVREDDIPGLEADGWHCTVGSVGVFDVFDIRPDHTGMAKVLLTKRR
jgi:hypothetical protein